MVVPSNHVYVRGGDGIVDAFLDVVSQAENVVTEAAESEIMAHHERLQSAAAQDPRWSSMAEDIQYWSDEEGNLAYGVPPTSQHHEQAMRTEYGDQTTPPTPLIRMGVVNGVAQMGWSLRQRFYEGGF